MAPRHIGAFAAGLVFVTPAAGQDPLEVMAKELYCGSLSDADQGTRLDQHRIVNYGVSATWIGVVRAPKF